MCESPGSSFVARLRGGARVRDQSSVGFVRRRLASERGQATVEFVALLPFAGLLVLLLWQAALAGEAFWLSGTAARAAARAQAVGTDPAAAARTVLPARFEHGLTVHAAADGTVAVVVPVPALIGGGALTSITTHARFEAQR